MNRKLLGVIVDDKPYWRNRLPVWFKRNNVELRAFSNYDAFEIFLKTMDRVDFILGDYNIDDVNVRQVGLIEIDQLSKEYLKKIGMVYVYTVLSPEEYKEKCVEYGIESTRYALINKSMRFNDLVSKIKSDCLSVRI
jgi:hypothetical protein